MEYIQSIIYLFALIVIIAIGVFNWMYKLELERVIGTEGFSIPIYVRRALTINVFLPLLTLFAILVWVVSA